MKLLIAVIIGLVLGFVSRMAYEDPKSISKQAHKIINAGEQRISQEKREQCQQAYLEDTGCFQHQKPDQCVKQMADRCGPADQ